MDNEVHANSIIHNSEDDSDNNANCYIYLRALLFMISLVCIFLNTIYGFALPHGNIECLVDQSFEYTKGINEYFKYHIGIRHSLMILSSMLLDFIVVYMAILWVIKGKSWRLYIALLVFFSFRYCIQVIIVFFF